MANKEAQDERQSINCIAHSRWCMLKSKMVSCILALAIFCFTASCATFPRIQRTQTKNLGYYIKQGDFSLKQEAAIEKAAEHISNSVSCVSLKRKRYYVFLETILVASMKKPLWNKATKRHTVGLYKKQFNIVKISTTSNEKGKLVEVSISYFYKVALHEFAHALGMRGHIFPEELSKESQLTPIIDAKSNPRLYQIDIDYLESLVCGKINEKHQ